MIIAGIDPGANGALALIDSAGLWHVEDVPKVGKDVDEVEWGRVWSNLLDREQGLTHIFLEQVGAMPGQGVTSMFSFGDRFGFVKALAYSAGVPVSFLRPQEWKKLVGIPNGAAKGASRLRASQLFPQHADQWARVKDDGRAEAVLIAYAGALKLGAIRSS
jgi:crossover junction endodeoxyribonuclease RuvC